jgi:hypothetical protein
MWHFGSPESGRRSSLRGSPEQSRSDTPGGPTRLQARMNEHLLAGSALPPSLPFDDGLGLVAMATASTLT